jgi:hypothetical protein
MTASNLPSQSPKNIPLQGEAKDSYKIRLSENPVLYLSFSKPEHGDQSTGEMYRVRELRVDSEGWLYAEYYLIESSELFVKFAIIGKSMD